MPEMSANAHQSPLAVAPAPRASAQGAERQDDVPPDPRPARGTPTGSPASAGVSSVTETPTVAPTTPTPPRRLTPAAAGYCLTTLGVTPVFIIPALKSYWIEDTLIFLAIAALLSGAALVAWAFLRDMFKRT